MSVDDRGNIVVVPDAPPLPGLTFRHFCDGKDYAAISTVIEGSKKEDQIEITSSVEEIARAYKHLVNCDPYQDMLFVEMRGHVIGYSSLRSFFSNFLSFIS